ncbi:HAMP domain-containing histidine kinase [Apilactobacillus sp. TMW 2.2459]|uniref:HAMP domain-containing sensor histidine kinase n=1 Tax=Apilactobacillus xinyiensis TaxID=2841032 RepID=UPI00200CBB60|nr:HAMP domain-containing histidine kinase [Apilactobacillus xinyiensis]MCL0311804.1 HAMP domain-containing histidine kinase [Apilactobacillus xinyiensis]
MNSLDTKKFSESSIDNSKMFHNKRRLSLKWKWSAGTSLIVFVMLSIFSFLVYNRFSDVLIHQERVHISETMGTISDKLGDFSRPLVGYKVDDVLTAKNSENNKLKEKSNDSNVSSAYSNSVFASLAKNNNIISVFDKDNNPVFYSSYVPQKYSKISNVNREHIFMDKFNNNNSLIGETPVFSKINGKRIGTIRVINKLGDYHYYTKKLTFILLFILVLGVFVAALLSYILAAYMLRPISVISKTINRINDSPENEVRVPKMHSNDELTDLASLFNDMLDTMQRYIEQQQQFVEDVSHELRTPVAVIQGHLNMLSRWGKDDPQILKESIDASVSEINRMKSLVQEMLDLSRAEQVEINYNDKITDAQDLVFQEYNDFKMIHPDFMFTLDNDIKKETLVQIYRNHLEQVLIILLDNAVKYSTKRKEVHISISRSTKNVDIAIQDFGEGISPKNMNKVFNRFYRVDKARSRNQGGNGLGLSIAKRLIEAYNGHLSVESSVGHGSIFRITLPILSQADKEKIQNKKSNQ